MAERKPLKPGEQSETTTINMNINMNMDRISSLPDHLLCHILSFLPIITSVATSVLSRRWRHLWKHLQVFNISEEPFYSYKPLHLALPDYPSRFVASVNAVLAQLSASPVQFRLSCLINDKNTVTAWIDAAIGPSLQELHLSLNPWFEVFRLPSVFACESLVSLTLEGKILLHHLSSVHLPSLKKLKLAVATVNPIAKLLSGSPVLETLDLSIEARKIHIPPSVNRSAPNDDNKWGVTEDLEIDAPSLKYLYIDTWTGCLQRWCLRLFVSEFPNMVEARLHFDPNDIHVAWLPRLFEALWRTKSLALSAATTECLLRAPALDIPDFCCLLRLQLDFPCFNSRFLIELLHDCHVLQDLVIHNHKFPLLSRQTNHPSGWTQPTSVPNCVTSYLKMLEFRGYEDSEEERAFIAYILQRGLVLKTMAIHTRVHFDLEKRDYMLKELSIIPRGSNICQLTLH